LHYSKAAEGCRTPKSWGIFDCAGKARLRRRFFHGGVTLGTLSASRFAKSREAERRKRVALRLPPHSKKHHCDGTQA